jgi:N-carbamoylputrescine amidase
MTAKKGRGLFSEHDRYTQIRVGLVQMRMGADPEANFAVGGRAHSRGGAAGRKHRLPAGAFRTQYFCQREDIGSSIWPSRFRGRRRRSWRRWRAKARVAIVASLFERRAPGLYHNTAVTLNADGKIAGVYRKMHIPDDPLYYEKYYFAPGDLGFQAVDWALAAWARWSAGTSGIRRARG